jgi:putative Ca2+/H+ antiporter (TMEM165/GDT1 family)
MGETLKNPILTANAIATASPKYGFINSQSIIDTFQATGWTVDQTQYSKVVKPEKDGFQKHMVWLKNANLPKISGLTNANESEVRLCLVNSHDCTSRLSIFLGIMRAACLNQLIAGTVFKYFHAVHSQNIVQKLPLGIDYVAQGIPELIDSIKELQAKNLSLDQRLELSAKVLPLRFSGVKNLINFDAHIVERKLRAEDTAQDAYTVANRLQEFLIRGGIPYSYTKTHKDLNGNILGTSVVATKTKKIASISKQIELNQALFAAIKEVA